MENGKGKKEKRRGKSAPTQGDCTPYLSERALLPTRMVRPTKGGGG